MSTSLSRRNWKRLQPTSLRQALEFCKDHARVKLNRSVERVAETMGVTDHWTIYKWIQTGRIPANLVRPFESACGIDYVTRWLAASAGKMTVDIPTGRALNGTDVVALHNGFGTALQLLTDFYAKSGDATEVMASLTAHLEDVAWHRANIEQHVQPGFDFTVH